MKPNPLEAARAKAAERLRTELTKRLNADVEPAAAVARMVAAGVDAKLEDGKVTIRLPAVADEPIEIDVGFKLGGAK